jgi:phosphatidylglycerol:prolipoprotein diacylglycerol transferase
MAAAVHPILLRIGSYEVPSYGAALALAFVLGIEVARRRARGAGIDERGVLDVCMVILVASLVGARALWVVTHPHVFRSPHGWLEALNLFSFGRAGVPGLSMLGGVGLAAAASVAWLAWRGMPVLAITDLLAPSVVLGEGVTRIGCFLNGCCFGVPCAHAFCLRFPPGSEVDRVFAGQAVHPTQLYASALGFAGFAGLSLLGGRRPFAGAVFFALLAFVGLSRLALDAVRHHDASTRLLRAGNLTVTSNDLFALACLAAGIGGWLWASARASRGGSAPA